MHKAQKPKLPYHLHTHTAYLYDKQRKFMHTLEIVIWRNYIFVFFFFVHSKLYGFGSSQANHIFVFSFSLSNWFNHFKWMQQKKNIRRLFRIAKTFYWVFEFIERTIRYYQSQTHVEFTLWHISRCIYISNWFHDNHQKLSKLFFFNWYFLYCAWFIKKKKSPYISSLNNDKLSMKTPKAFFPPWSGTFICMNSNLSHANAIGFRHHIGFESELMLLSGPIHHKPLILISHSMIDFQILY